MFNSRHKRGVYLQGRAREGKEAPIPKSKGVQPDAGQWLGPNFSSGFGDTFWGPKNDDLKRDSWDKESGYTKRDVL